MKSAVAIVSLSVLLAAPLSSWAQQAPAAAPAAAPAPAATAQQRAAAETAPGLPAAVDKLAALITSSLPKSSGEIKIAIAPFANLGPTAHEKKLGEVVSELLVTRLSGKPGIVIIERAQIDQILDELKLSMLGLTEGSNAEKVGKLLGADAMIVGSVSEIGAKFAISARHVDMATSRVMFAKEVQVPQADAIALSSKYVVTKSRGDALFRSVIVPGWGQVYNNQDAKGYVFTGVTLGVIGAGLYERMQYGNTHNEYMKATTKDKAQSLYDQQSSQYQQSNLLFYIAGGIWALNIVDAFINGTSASEVHVDKEEAAPAHAALAPSLGVTSDGTQTAGLQWNF